MELRKVLISEIDKGYLHEFVISGNNRVYGIVELEDGTLEEVELSEIKFVPSTKQMENTNPK